VSPHRCTHFHKLSNGSNQVTLFKNGTVVRVHSEFLDKKKTENAGVEVQFVGADRPRAEGIPVSLHITGHGHTAETVFFLFFSQLFDEARFTMHRELGKGQFGVVMDATDKTSGNRVAIKSIRNTGPKVETVVKREYELMKVTMTMPFCFSVGFINS
jgi:hypothetical protein